MFLEIVKFVVYSILIVVISKYILVETLRKLAENLNLKAKTARKYSRHCNIHTRITNNKHIFFKRVAKCKCLQHYKLKHNKFNSVYCSYCIKKKCEKTKKQCNKNRHNSCNSNYFNPNSNSKNKN